MFSKYAEIKYNTLTYSLLPPSLYTSEVQRSNRYSEIDFYLTLVYQYYQNNLMGAPILNQLEICFYKNEIFRSLITSLSVF